jgi:hypothetical protein
MGGAMSCATAATIKREMIGKDRKKVVGKKRRERSFMRPPDLRTDE